MSFVVGSNNQKCAPNMLSRGARVVEDADLYPACKMFQFHSPSLTRSLT